MLSERFDKLLAKIKNPMLRHPVFYSCPVAIRFEIGSEEMPVYLDTSHSSSMTVNPEYIETAYQRAKAIYAALPQRPDLLVIDLSVEYESEYKNTFDLTLFKELVYSLPHEQRKIRINDGEEYHTIFRLYWELYKIDFSADRLLKEIIKADLGGISALASSVYFANTETAYLYHLYDDRGADLAAEQTETLYPIYQTFKKWILNYNRKEIDKLFTS